MSRHLFHVFDAVAFTFTERKLTGSIPSSSDLNRFSNELNLGHEKASGAFDRASAGASDEDAELVATLERYRTLFRFAPDPYLVTDQSGTIEEANAAAADLLGVDSSMLERRSIVTYVDAESKQTLNERLSALESSTRPQKWVMGLHSSHGEVIPVEATVSLGQRIANRVSLAWMLRDVSDRFRAEESMNALNRSLNARVAQRTRELELALQGEQSARKEAEAANRIKTELFARLSHEFRTPLHAVSGYLEILQQNIHGGLTHEQRQDVDRIHQAQEHMLALVNMILDFAKLEGGPIELSMSEIPIEETLRGAEALVEPQFAKKAIAYTHHAGNPALTVFADREKVQQIVLNLLANAMRFTPEGGAVDLDWRVENDTVLVRIRDTGPGIPEDEVERIFEPFVQLREPRSAPSGGTGLGLAISRDLARAMGGDVGVRSNAGAGSVFTLELPLRKHILG
ncbi:MAG: ATP-binding protein [Gemmatimonadaceae bacterium]